MKKILLLIVTLLFIVTLSACTEDVPTLVDFDALETTVVESDASITALETDLAALETELATLETELMNLEAMAVVDADITKLEGEAYTAHFHIQTQIADLEMQIADVEALIVDLQDQIDLLEIELEEQIFNLQDQVNPLYLLETEVTQIIIAHTNDTHGRVNDDGWAGTIGMASVKNIVDVLKDSYPNTYLVAAGDMFHGTTFATLEEGESMVNVMNQVGYDLMVPGNHDFDYGQDRLLELEELADFPMISANIQYAVDDTDFMSPYYIEDFDGVDVAFFGLTTPETVYKTHPDNVTGLNFLDPIVQATAMVAELEDMADVIILMAHVGLDDNTTITTEDIANAVDGIDVIIDGHSHTTLPDGMMVNDTLIVSAGEYLNNLGVFSLSVQDGEIVSYEVMLVDADKVEALAYGADEDVQDYIDVIVEDQDVILSEVVGQTAVVLDGERADVRTGETNLGNLIADSMIVVTGADVAITNGGGIRASIPVGDVTLGDVITVLPFGNIIVTKDLTGQQILDTLEYATSAYPDAEGMFPHVAGMTFAIDLEAAEGSRVINLEIDGDPVDLGATYSVATNDFLAAGGDGYELFESTPITGEFMGLHEALTDMFTVDVDIEMPTMNRILVYSTPEPLFFSEYAEADGGSCKYVEIYNPTAEAVNLNTYKIINAYNGNTWDYTNVIQYGYILPLDGMLPAGEAYVIYANDCVALDGESQDPLVSDPLFPTDLVNELQTGSSAVGFNGDDTIGLFYGDTLIDVIGEYNVDPGSSWPVGNGDLLGGTTANVIMVRVPTVAMGETDWAVGAMQWIVSADDRDYSTVGIHTYTPAS